ncbi:MAG: aminomethyl-transferring glycine dehydrogenase [Saprospiraceae bacterium]|nr:aminomethyl-transferring glycine dehydrogenase [Saprospiraceae bacterium]
MSYNFTSSNRFQERHIGPNQTELNDMLATIGVDSLETLIDQTVPANIRLDKPLNLPSAKSESLYLRDLKAIANKNKVFNNFIGMGYYGTVTPSVILRNVFENPGWYTQYTPYQAEIAQGRLEAILNFQTMVSDLTALPIANASLLDEGTAAAEAMTMFYGEKNKKVKNPADAARVFLVDEQVFPATIDVLRTRAQPLSIEVKIGNWQTFDLTENVFGVLLQYPNVQGEVEDYRAFALKCNENKVFLTVATDLMALALLTPPGEWGADCAVGNSQRFGVPMGFGGPHAAFFATKDEFKRQIPGRIIGVSVDTHGNPALRMALQTREQHIRREKATSNICTAQALLAIMASMYGVYHGPQGLKNIAEGIHHNAVTLERTLSDLGFDNLNKNFFDTLRIEVRNAHMLRTLKEKAEKAKVNFWYEEDAIRIALDETVTTNEIAIISSIFTSFSDKLSKWAYDDLEKRLPAQLERTSPYLTHPVFNSYHTESKMMRYIKRLENKDLSLVHSMISLGSCTMKLNAASEMIPVSWAEFANIHPFAPSNQTKGYQEIINHLSKWLCEITGFDACSLQPNSGAQGEYAGLLTIKAYHEARGDKHRKIALIPSSAHGTNPASAVMVGMDVVVVACDERGNIDVADLKNKAEQYKDNLACLMVTYPSTHGVFETSITEICAIIHKNGGKVYMDGANMNAQVGLTSPGRIGADVCHLNLHKTFAIPHGGGGPGMGPICCNKSLAPYLPGHVIIKTGGSKATHAVSSAPFGSASILLISYGYIQMLGTEGVTDATRFAILNANYMKARLEKAFPILYTGENGRCAHEMIVDLRPFKSICSAEDVAKRLMDYGFHAPTLSFPVAGTIMIEPTESESKDELDRFCDALLAIKEEMDEIARGEYPADDNVLVNAPHTNEMVIANDWTHAYSREKAAYPLPYLRQGFKFWATVGRVNSAAGDRNLICVCPPIESYA